MFLTWNDRNRIIYFTELKRAEGKRKWAKKKGGKKHPQRAINLDPKEVRWHHIIYDNNARKKHKSR